MLRKNKMKTNQKLTLNLILIKKLILDKENLMKKILKLKKKQLKQIKDWTNKLKKVRIYRIRQYKKNKIRFKGKI